VVSVFCVLLLGFLRNFLVIVVSRFVIVCLSIFVWNVSVGV